MNNTSSTIVADTGLTTEEITTASRHLSVTRGFLLESVGGLCPAQWDFKPASDSWSVAENMEHIVLIESGIHAIIERMNEASGPVPEGDRREMDGFILTQIPKRSRRGKSPSTPARPAAGVAPKLCSSLSIAANKPPDCWFRGGFALMLSLIPSSVHGTGTNGCWPPHPTEPGTRNRSAK